MLNAWLDAIVKTHRIVHSRVNFILYVNKTSARGPRWWRAQGTELSRAGWGSPLDPTYTTSCSWSDSFHSSWSTTNSSCLYKAGFRARGYLPFRCVTPSVPGRAASRESNLVGGTSSLGCSWRIRPCSFIRRVLIKTLCKNLKLYQAACEENVDGMQTGKPNCIKTNCKTAVKGVEKKAKLTLENTVYLAILRLKTKKNFTQILCSCSWICFSQRYVLAFLELIYMYTSVD